MSAVMATVPDLSGRVRVRLAVELANKIVVLASRAIAKPSVTFIGDHQVNQEQKQTNNRD
jgi:hypothetical protein